MATIDTALTTLASAKLMLGIPSGDTSSDAMIEARINAVSVAIATFCNRRFGKRSGIPTYTEKLSASNRQLLLLPQWPIVDDPSVSEEGVSLVINVDFRCDEQDRSRGELYKENGWRGIPLVSGITANPVGMDRGIDVTYKAGYYLPGDASYVAGDPASLPLDISIVADEMVAESVMNTKRGSLGNLRSISEGGLSYSFGMDSASYGNVLSGIRDAHANILAAYKRWFVA